MYLRHSVSIPAAVSRALAEGLVANGLPRARVVHNGIPPDDFLSGDSAFQEVSDGWGLGRGPAILAGGRLSHFKGHERALRAFHRAAANQPDARLLVMGGYGWYGERLARIAADLGISNQVKFLGLVSRDAVAGVLNRAAAVLTLSLYLDPFPTMNLEAMAASRAVLGTCYGGTPEAVEHGVTGYIVNPYDDAATADRIAGILSDPDLAARLGKAGRERMLECFSVDRMAADYESIYDASLAG
jgi:type III pantothenate kinase